MSILNSSYLSDKETSPTPPAEKKAEAAEAKALLGCSDLITVNCNQGISGTQHTAMW